jgi:hypothetical protein
MIPLVRAPHLGVEIMDKEYKVGFKKPNIMEMI